VPSPLIGRNAPDFNLPVLGAQGRTMSAQDMRGKVWLLNVWASWCVACRLEHPLVLEAAKAGAVPIYGLNYKDQPAEARQWLEKFGNPYVSSLSDREGLVGIDFGVYGVPETFVIDRAGVVRYRQAGPLTRASIDRVILPLVGKLQKENARD
jgi:cytochrome c biogenesis protein CcmG/thiol:disulfide interchange protein DsbE